MMPPHENDKSQTTSEIECPSCGCMWVDAGGACARCSQTTADWSDWDAESAGFACELGVGLTIADDISGVSQGSRLLCWTEVVAFHKWLGEKIVGAESNV